MGCHCLLQGVQYSDSQSLKLYSIYCCSVAKLYLTLCDPWTAAHQTSLCFTISQSLLKLMSIESVMLSYHLIPVTPFSSCPQSFPESESFPMNQLFTSGQSIGDSTSASVLPVNIQGWFPLGWTGLISLLSKEVSRVFSSTTVLKHRFFGVQPSLWSNSHPYMMAGKTIALTMWTFEAKWCFYFVICCLCLSQLFFQGASILIPWL